jgi:hypothetical protein
VLSSRFDSVRAPHLLAEREAGAAENLTVARTLDDPMALWLAVIGQTQLAVETGDADALDASLDREIRLAEELPDVAGGEIRNVRDDLDRGIHAGQRPGGGDGFGDAIAGVGFVEEPLALEVAQLDVVPVDQKEAADASAGERPGLEAAERAATHDGDR